MNVSPYVVALWILLVFSAMALLKLYLIPAGWITFPVGDPAASLLLTLVLFAAAITFGAGLLHARNRRNRSVPE